LYAQKNADLAHIYKMNRIEFPNYIRYAQRFDIGTFLTGLSTTVLMLP
jgi:hypothetical protein